METKYNVVFTGQLRSEFSYENIVRDMIAISSMSEAEVEKLLSAGKPKFIKKNLDQELAEKYMRRLEQIGLQMRVSKVEEATQQKKTISASKLPEQPTPEPPPQTKQESGEDITSNAKRDALQPSTKPSEIQNPYASPKANLKVEKKATEKIMGAPQKVPSSHGWLWIKRAFGMFLAEPWKWSGMVLVVGLILVPISLIPFIGVIFNTLLGMVLGGGLMLAANIQFEGGILKFSHMFKGFTHNRNQLIMVGVLYLIGFLLIGGVVALFMGTGIWSMMGVGNNPEAASLAMQQNLPLFLIAILIGLGLSVPLVMSIWFATCLVAIGDLKATSAFKLSFQGCLKNILPFLVYGLAFLVIGIVIAIVFSIVIGGLVFLFGDGGSIFFIVLPMLLVVLLGIPSMIITSLSIFTGFKDIFYESA